MSFLGLLFGKKQKTAAVAKNRLQLIIAHERKDSVIPNFMPQMREEIIQVIEKYLPQIQRENIKINQEFKDDLNIVEVSIPLENTVLGKPAAAVKKPVTPTEIKNQAAAKMPDKNAEVKKNGVKPAEVKTPVVKKAEIKKEEEA